MGQDGLRSPVIQKKKKNGPKSCYLYRYPTLISSDLSPPKSGSSSEGVLPTRKPYSTLVYKQVCRQTTLVQSPAVLVQSPTVLAQSPAIMLQSPNNAGSVLKGDNPRQRNVLVLAGVTLARCLSRLGVNAEDTTDSKVRGEGGNIVSCVSAVVLYQVGPYVNAEHTTDGQVRGRGGTVLIIMHGRRTKTVDARVPIIPGRSTWGLHQSGRRGWEGVYSFIITHGHSLFKTMDRRIPAIPSRSTSGFSPSGQPKSGGARGFDAAGLLFVPDMYRTSYGKKKRNSASGPPWTFCLLYCPAMGLVDHRVERARALRVAC